MKRLHFSGAILGLTVLLASCGDVTPPTHSLTVKLGGVPSASVKITNTTTKAVVFNGTLEGSKTFSELKAGDVFKVEGSVVNGYTAPAAQTVALDGDKTVTLSYTAVTPPPATTHSLTVKVEGVGGAPVTVTDTTTNAVVFSGALEGSKTFGDLKAGDVFRVEGGAVNDFTAPAAQTVTLDGDKAVTLTYTAVTPPPVITHNLTVKVEGVTSAPVIVTDTSTNAQVFSGILEGSKTFGSLKAGDVFKVEGGTVNDYAAPGTQTITLDGDKTVTLSYAALPGTALNPARVRGTLEGWTFGTGELKVMLAYSREFADASTPTITPSGNVDAGLPVPMNLTPFLRDCTFTGEQTAADFGSEFALFEAFSARGDDLGHVIESTTDGRGVLRLYSDTTARFKGVALCPYSERLDLDISLVRGWNALSVTEVNSADYRYDSRVRNLEAGTRTVLSFRQAAERTDVLFSDNSPLTLRAGEQATRDVVLSQQGGISGQVTLETDVPGVTVTPSTLSLPTVGTSGVRKAGLSASGAGVRPQSLGTSLTFTADAGAKGYNGPLSVIVKKGGEEVGRGTLYSFSLRAPSVSISIPEAYNALSVYQGGTSGLKVSVGSVEGFSGSTTLTVEGLPTGVSAPSVTVQVTPGTTTTVTIPLTAAADATLGDSTVTVTSPDAGTSQGPNSAPLSVRPARTSIGSGASSLARGSAGVWIAGEGNYDPTTSTSTTRLTRYVGTQAVTTVTLPVGYPQLLPLPSGDLLVVGSGASVYRVTDAGSVTPLPNPVSNGLGDAAVDAQGQVWFVRHTSTGMGGQSNVLARWNPETGEVVTTDSSRDYGYSGGTFAASNDGRTLIYLPYSGGMALKIGALTGTISDLGVSLSSQNGSVAVSDSGSIWFTQYGALKRLNSDGSVTTFEGVNVDRLTGFDRVDADTLWGAGYSNAYRIDASTGKVTHLFLGSVSRAATPNGGGLNVVTSEYVSGSQQFYLSFLK